MFFYKKIYYSYLDILKNKKVINLFGIKFTIPGKIIKYNTTWSRLSCENYVNSIK